MKYFLIFLLTLFFYTHAQASGAWVKKNDINKKESYYIFSSKDKCEAQGDQCFDVSLCPKNECSVVNNSLVQDQTKKAEKDLEKIDKNKKNKDKKDRKDRLKAANPSDQLLKDILDELLDK